PPVNQHQSQRLFRLHGLLGQNPRHCPRRSHPRRVRQTEIRTPPHRRRPNLASTTACQPAPRARRGRRLRRQQHLHRNPAGGFGCCSHTRPQHLVRHRRQSRPRLPLP